MKLRFLSLEIESFKSFVGKHKLSFADEREGLHFMRGINLIQPRLGSNGAGKSSVWDAACWCLYGRTVSGLKGPDIRAWGDRGGRTRVWLTLTVDDIPHTVERTAHPNALLINSKDAGPEGPAKLIGLSYELFVHTILLGQGQPLFFDLQPRDKLQLFTDVLDLDRWDSRAFKAAQVTLDLNTDLTACATEIGGAENQVREIESLLKSVTEQSEEWDEQRDKKIAEATTALAEANKLAEKAYLEHSKAEMAAQGAGMELKHYEEEVQKYNLAVRAAEAAVAKHNAKVSGWKGQVRELKGQLGAFGPKDICPICQQSIKGTAVAKHKQELRIRVEELQGDIDEGVPKELTAEVTKQEKQLARYERHLKDERDKSDKADTDLRHWGPRLAEVKATVLSLERSLQELEGQENPFSNQISQLKKRKGKHKREVTDLTDEKKQLEARIERTKFWVQGFKDIRLLIIDEVLQQLELTTNAALAEVGMPDWQVRYDIEKETKAGTIKRGLMVEILSPSNKSAVRWESWSGGEGQRLRLVGALALSEVLLNYAGVQTNLEILDEPTRHLSVEGVRDLCDYLAGRALQLSRQTWLVDHMAVESARFKSVLTVIKDKKGTRLEHD